MMVVFLGVTITIILHFITGVPITTMVGILSGAVTNTPGLGAAQQANSDLNGIDAPEIALGYAVAYPLGVVGCILSLLALKYILRINTKTEEADAERGLGHLQELTVRPISLEIRNEAVEGKTIKEIKPLVNRDFVISRIRHCDGDRQTELVSICHRNFPCRYTLPYSSETGVESFTPSAKKMKIAIARDPAFNFIYRENIDRLSALGSITYFSPVYGSDLPDADLVYLPGGYPELFARQLHRRKKLMEALRTYAEEGGKILAECGGMMFLTRSLTARQGGTAYAMTGILPLDCTMVGARLHLGYRRIEYKGMELRGHEFHYSNVVAPDAMPSVAKQFTARGMEVSTPLYRYKNVIAGYTHLYWGETDILKLWKV
jgi:cobyrinic acid a,c-diamide synthase